MMEMGKYVTFSLELHLFFARIMKEHSLFLEAGFASKDQAFVREAESFKKQFENLLFRTVRLSNGLISRDVLFSGEIITEFTRGAECKTQQLTGISINQNITNMESHLHWGDCEKVSMETVQQVKQLNNTAIRLLDGLIAFKEKIINNVLCCKMFTMNYPLLIEHILREAKLYRTYVICFEKDRNFDCQNMKQIEQFWNQIMMEHALFIRGLLDPTENDLINTSNAFANDYAQLLNQSRTRNDLAMGWNNSRNETLKFKEFKTAGAQGICNCSIRSIILPLLADHVLREANHYLRLLSV